MECFNGTSSNHCVTAISSNYFKIDEQLLTQYKIV